MTIKNLFCSLHACLIGCAFGFSAASMSAYATPVQPTRTPGIYHVIIPPSGEKCDYLSGWSQGLKSLTTPQDSAPHRLTVADFMGTWKVYAKCGEEVIPSFNVMYQEDIGKTVTFSPAKAVDRTGGDVLSLPILEGKRKPVYIVEYKRLYPDTPYPNIDPPQYQYDTPQPYAFIYFKVGYFSKIEKKIFYEDFYVGSNDKSFPFALTVDLGDTDLYLCKLNPKTGQCQDHP
jgi:hypothetical protein